MSFAPHLSFNGQAREAMTFYAGVFGATDLQIMDYAAAPPGAAVSAAPARVLHAQFTAGPGAPLLASDLPEGQALDGRLLSVFHAAPSVDGARAIFQALAQGGQVQIAFGPIFWTPAYGEVVDRFGVKWMITVAPGAT